MEYYLVKFHPLPLVLIYLYDLLKLNAPCIIFQTDPEHSPNRKTLERIFKLT
jgi:hypothetical protein